MKVATEAKRIWQALALLIVLAVVAGVWWRKQSPPQIITLPSGEKFQFIAAEWGANQVQPTAAARFIARLPAPIAGYVYRKLGDRLGIVTPIGTPTWSVPGQILPPESALHFWFRSHSTNTSSVRSSHFMFMLADQNGVAAGGKRGWTSYGQGTSKWLTFAFPTAPRRSETIQLLVFKTDDPFDGPYTQIGTVRFRNPLYGLFPDWQPESLPITKTNEDLIVRLTDFRVGTRHRGADNLFDDGGKPTRFDPSRPGEDQEIVFKLDVQSPRGTNNEWFIQPAELSDATGNRIQTDWCYRFSDTDEYHFGPALWSDEAAWRLKLTLKRFQGHDPEEIVTFTHVPVPAIAATNTVFQTNVIHGVPVVLKQQFIRHPDQLPVTRGSDSDTRAIAELVDAPQGFVVDYKELKTDTGWTPRQVTIQQTSNSFIAFLDSIPADARTLDISWAVQKARAVEFLVKPPQPK